MEGKEAHRSIVNIPFYIVNSIFVCESVWSLAASPESKQGWINEEV